METDNQINNIGDLLNDLRRRLKPLDQFRKSKDISLLRDILRTFVASIPSNPTTSPPWEFLPAELILLIARMCGEWKKVNQTLSQVCKSWNNALSNQNIWRMLSLQKMSFISMYHQKIPEVSDWKKFYLKHLNFALEFEIMKKKAITLSQGTVTPEWLQNFEKQVLSAQSVESLFQHLLVLQNEGLAKVLSSKGEDFPMTLANIDKKLLQLEQKTPWHSVLQIFRPMQPIWKYHSQIISHSNSATILNGAIGCIKAELNPPKIASYGYQITNIVNEINLNLMKSSWLGIQDKWIEDASSKDIRRVAHAILQFVDHIEPSAFDPIWFHFQDIWRAFRLPENNEQIL